MKPVTKTLVIIAIAIISIGIILSVVALAIGGFDFNNYNSLYEKQSYTYDSEGISGLIVNDVSCDVNIIGTEDKTVRIDCYESENEKYDIELSEDGKLSINFNTSKKWYQYIIFNFDYQKRTLDVYVPYELAGAVEVKNVSGDISMKNLDIGSSLSIKNTSGKIELKDIAVSGDMSVKTVSGNIGIINNSVSDDLEISSTSGEIDISSTEILKNMTIKSVSGDIDFVKTSAKGDIDVENTSGGIGFKEAAGNNISLKAVSGNIKGDITGEPEDYTIKSSTVSGDINLPRSENGDKLLKVSTVSGSIDIDISSYTE